MSAYAAVVLPFCLLLVSSVLVYVPQLVQLARGAEPTGLSAASLVGGAVNYLFWTIYLGSLGWSALLVCNVLAMVVWWATTALALRRLPLTRGCLVPLAWAGLLLALLVVAPGALGPVLGLSVLFTYVPQVVTAWTAPSVAGLSVVTWALCVLQGMVWFAQSLPGMLVGGLVFGVVSTIGSGLVVAAIVVRRRPASLTQDDLALAA